MMDQAKAQKVAENCRQQAESYIHSGNFGRAFSHLLVALKLNPHWQIELKQILASSLYEWSRFLEGKKRFTDLFNCYEQALEVFPNNELVLNNLGEYLLRYGSAKEAWGYFEKSLAVNPLHLSAVRNLENASNLLVERWHFRMLNDVHRNDAFREAIRKAVRRWNCASVLDIGTGTGLLSLFSAEVGVPEIHACDSSVAMIDIAKHVFQANDVADRVNLLEKHSTCLKIPEDLPDRVDLVVCEILDCGLLGEHVLDTLVHAWEDLLNENGHVVPCSATLHVAGIRSADLARKYHVSSNSNLLFQFNHEAFAPMVDSYDTEDLRRVNSTYVTDPCKVADIDFNNSSELQELLNGTRDAAFSLSVCDSGRLDCLIAWFELRLDADIVLDTSPESIGSWCWDQAVFPLPRPLDVYQHEELVCNVSFRNGKLSVTCEREVSTEHRLSEPAALLLNSNKVTRYLREVQDDVARTFKKSVSVLDTWPFPVFGLNFLVSGRDARDKLLCVVAADCDKRAVEWIAKENGIEEQVKCVVEEDYDVLLEDAEEDSTFDVIVANPCDTSGELRERFLSLRENLKDGGVLLPDRVTVMGKLVDSAWLDRVCRVSDHEYVTRGFFIQPFINLYQTRTQIDFDVNSIESVNRSDCFELFALPASDSEPQQFTVERTVPVSCYGRINALLYWMKFGHVETVSDAHVRQAAVLFSPVKCSQTLKLSIVYDAGLFKVDLVDAEPYVSRINI